MPLCLKERNCSGIEEGRKPVPRAPRVTNRSPQNFRENLGPRSVFVGGGAGSIFRGVITHEHEWPASSKKIIAENSDSKKGDGKRKSTEKGISRANGEGDEKQRKPGFPGTRAQEGNPKPKKGARVPANS